MIAVNITGDVVKLQRPYSDHQGSHPNAWRPFCFYVMQIFIWIWLLTHALFLMLV